MTPMRSYLAGWMTALLILLAPTVAKAACIDLRTAIIAPEDINIGLVQRGLQTALEDNNALLADGRLGPYTRTRLVQSCGQFPLPDDSDSIAGSITMAEEYGELAGAVNDWKITSSEAEFGFALLPSDDSPVNAQIVLLLGPPRPRQTHF